MQTLHQFQKSFDTYLAENRFVQSPKELYEPANYMLSIGGKRLRPAVLLAGHYLFDDAFEKSLHAAFAVEVFHNFTLVHDDIMDAAPLRRGMPTVHHKYDLNTGILSGDAMLVLAYDYLLKTESPQLWKVAKAFNQMAIQVCEGQQMDMNFETHLDVQIDDYLKMIELKTAVLVATALEIGALIGGGSTEDAKNLYEFGRNLGIAFQLQDDILDAFGDSQQVGKKTGGDIIQNKKTYLYLKAIEIAPIETGMVLKDLFSNKSTPEESKINQVISIFNELNIKELADSKKEEYLQRALASLDLVNALPKKKSLLKVFASTLMDRQF